MKMLFHASALKLVVSIMIRRETGLFFEKVRKLKAVFKTYGMGNLHNGK
jgi:hypothetical protein